LELVMRFTRQTIDIIDVPEDLFDRKAYAPSCPSAASTHNDHHFSPLPVLVYASKERYTIIDGCKRYLALCDRGIKECDCCVIEPTPDSIQAGLLRISSNRERSWNIREKIKFLSWMKKNLPENDYYNEIAIMQIPAHERFEIEQLGSGPEQLVDAVAEGKIDLPVTGAILALEEPDRNDLIDFFSCFDSSLQTQRELVEWLPEIAFRKGVPLKTVINDEIKPVINDWNTNAPQKIQKLRELLYTIRFPMYTGVLKQWEKDVADINPAPQNVHFRQNPGFEKDQLAIVISVTDPAQAISIFDRLKDVPQEQWKRLINPLDRLSGEITNGSSEPT
jgi:hypothetical protein